MEMFEVSCTEKIVGIETPKEPPGHWLAAWCFSIGEESVTSTSDLSFCLRNRTSFVHQILGTYHSHLQDMGNHASLT